MKVDRSVSGWALAALVLGILAVVVIIPAFRTGPAEGPSSAARSTSEPSYPTAFLSSTFPADDPARDSMPPSILPVVILKGSDYEMGFQYGEQACAYIDRPREDKG